MEDTTILSCLSCICPLQGYDLRAWSPRTFDFAPKAERARQLQEARGNPDGLIPWELVGSDLKPLWHYRRLRCCRCQMSMAAAPRPTRKATPLVQAEMTAIVTPRNPANGPLWM